MFDTLLESIIIIIVVFMQQYNLLRQKVEQTWPEPRQLINNGPADEQFLARVVG